jgi:hypothetical protein
VAEVAAAHGGTAEAAQMIPHGLRVTVTLPVSPLGDSSSSGITLRDGNLPS